MTTPPTFATPSTGVADPTCTACTATLRAGDKFCMRCGLETVADASAAPRGLEEDRSEEDGSFKASDAEIAAFGSGAAAPVQAPILTPPRRAPSPDAHADTGELEQIVAGLDLARKPRPESSSVDPPPVPPGAPGRARPGMLVAVVAATTGACVMYLVMKGSSVTAEKPASVAPVVAVAPRADAPSSPLPAATPAAASAPAEVAAAASPAVGASPSDSVAAASAEAASESRPLEQTSAPSFDCDKSTLRAEMLVCQNADLVQADLKLSAAYKATLAHALSRDDAARIRDDQRQWLSGRRNLCDSVDCLRAAYQIRLEILASRPGEQH